MAASKRATMSVRVARVAVAVVVAVVGVNAITSIPYDSTLVLGNIIDTDKIASLMDIAELQKPVDIAQDSYNALLRTRLSLAMSREELKSLGVNDDASALDAALAVQQAQLDVDIGTTLMARIKAEMAYQKAYAAMVGAQKQKKIGEEPESPLDFAASQLQDMPISSDTMNLDVQYFRTEQTTQSSGSLVSKVSSWVSSSVSTIFGAAVASKAKASAEAHMNSQVENNDLLGTVCIYVSATHKKAKLFSPTKYDPIKLVRAWNMINAGGAGGGSDGGSGGGGARINLPKDTDKLYTEWVQGKESKERLNLLSGVTYGSSFIGFIHFVQKSQTTSFEEATSQASAAQTEATRTNFIASITGGWGMDEASANDVKSLMSSNLITSHVGLITMGLIPSLASQGVETALKKFTQFSPDTADAMISKLATNTDNNGAPADMDTAAAANIRAGKMAAIQKNEIGAVLTGIADVDQQTNQVLNMNSLMLALDDYIKTARDADGGVPVNFFVTQLQKNDVISEWMNKFRPDLYQRAMSPAAAGPAPSEGGGSNSNSGSDSSTGGDGGGSNSDSGSTS